MLNPPKGSIRLNVFSLGLCHVSIPLTPFSRGHIRALGLSIASWLSLPADSGRSSDDDLLNPLNPMFFIETLSQTAIPDNRCLTECDFIRENPPSSGQVIDFEQLIRKTPPVYGQTWHFESTFYSNRFMVASRTASHRKKLNSHADSTKLVKPSRRIARLSQSP